MSKKNASKRPAVTQPKAESFTLNIDTDLLGWAESQAKEKRVTLDEYLAQTFAGLKKSSERPELLRWLAAMPEGFDDAHGEISMPVTLTLDTCAWLVYARAAKKRGESIEVVLNHILRSVDRPFEEDGYLTEFELRERQGEERRLAGGVK